MYPKEFLGLDEWRNISRRNTPQLVAGGTNGMRIKLGFGLANIPMKEPCFISFFHSSGMSLRPSS